MSSFSAPFVGSASSARSNVREVIQSYRRSQYLVAGSNLPSNSDSSDFEDDEEAQIQHPSRRFLDEDDFEESETLPGPAAIRDDSFIGQVNWDEDNDQVHPKHTFRKEGISPANTKLTGTLPTEQTALLGKVSRISFSNLPRPTHPAVHDSQVNSLGVGPSYQTAPQPPTRRMSSTSVRSVSGLNYDFGGQSTYGQTLFNSIAILLGIGMLSEPLAFAYAGWIAGTILIVSYGYVACYTAKILAHIILADPRIRSYADVGRKAFGPAATPAISFMFCLELFSVSVVLVTLYGDSLHSLLPQQSSNTYKAWGIIFLLPSVFLPLSLLSYTSILGILSTFLLLFVIFFDGFSKTSAPGSLWQPNPTDLGVQSVSKLGVAFGLFMAGFSGHAVIPSLARDMIDPSQFDHMINRAFIVATCVYTIMGYVGYLMFGRDVSDEISIDLLATPGYNPLLNTLCLWLLVVSPLSKFGLNTQPLNSTIEILLGLDAPLASPGDLAVKPNGHSVTPKRSHFGRWRRFLAVIQRVLVTSLSITVSIMIPEFSSMMAFVGSFSAFMISIVGPVIAKVMIDRRCGCFDTFIIVFGTIMAVWGTVAAFS